MISLFGLLLLVSATAVSARMHLSCTDVTAIINNPLHTKIKNQFLADDDYRAIQKMMHAFITGNTYALEREKATLIASPIFDSPTEVGGFLASARRKMVNFLRAKTPAIEECVSTVLPELTTGVVGSIAHNCANAFAVTHAYYRLAGEREHGEEKELLRFPLLRIAHDTAFDIFISLVLLLQSPRARACDRMAALFLINHCIILGKRSRNAKHYIARLNRYYFSPTGHLLYYDPQHWTYRDRFIKKLDRFLMMVSDSKQQYIHYLRTGIAMGITELIEQYSAVQNREWHQRRPHTVRCYANSFLKTLTGGRLCFWKSIEPALIHERTITQSFMELIKLCLFTPTLSKAEKEQNAYRLIEKCRLSAPLYGGYLERFFKELT